MIRITLDLISARGANRNRRLGVIEIVNDGSGGTDTGNYNFTLSKWETKTSEAWKRGRVENFDRKGRGVYDLLYLGLRNIVGDRNR